MKTEHKFNAWLSKEFTRLEPGLTAYKTADKYTEGVPDFIVWASVRSAGIESKIAASMNGRGTRKFLKRPFTGPQRTWLRKIRGTGNPALGLVHVDEEELMFAVPYEDIPATGNWTLLEFTEKGFKKFKRSREGVHALVEDLFQGDAWYGSALGYGAPRPHF